MVPYKTIRKAGKYPFITALGKPQFIVSGSQQVTILVPSGTSGNVSQLNCHSLREQMATSAQRPRMLLRIRKTHRRATTTKNYLAQNVKSAKDE